MVSLCFNRHVLNNFECYVLSKFFHSGGKFSPKFFTRGSSYFSKKPFFYQLDLFSVFDKKVFLFDVKKDTNGRYKAVIKCGNINLKNDDVIKPTKKVLEIYLPHTFTNYNGSNKREIEDDLMAFSILELPRLLFNNYKLNDNRTLYDEWTVIMENTVKAQRQAEEQRERERLEELRRQKELEEEKERIKREKELAELNKLKGEEIF